MTCSSFANEGKAKALKSVMDCAVKDTSAILLGRSHVPLYKVLSASSSHNPVTLTQWESMVISHTAVFI